jgi:polyphosphate kinase 2
MGEFNGKAYRKALEPIEEELNMMHRWLQHTGQRLVIVFEGRDTAGKGGAIGVFTDCLNPRTCRVVALPKPSDRERTQWYFQRYVQHLPSAGEIVLFDRSWYNRAGVERVMGFCSDEEYERFLVDCPAFERMLVANGILLRKYWLGCDQARQEERFKERIEDPVKRWKISPIDLASRTKYEAYTKARNRMLEATDIPEAPWYLVDMDDQKRGRLNLAKHLLDSLPDHEIAYDAIEMAPLAKKPAKETWPRGVAKVKSVY